MANKSSRQIVSFVISIYDGEKKYMVTVKKKNKDENFETSQHTQKTDTPYFVCLKTMQLLDQAISH